MTNTVNALLNTTFLLPDRVHAGVRSERRGEGRWGIFDNKLARINNNNA